MMKLFIIIENISIFVDGLSQQNRKHNIYVSMGETCTDWAYFAWLDPTVSLQKTLLKINFKKQVML